MRELPAIVVQIRCSCLKALCHHICPVKSTLISHRTAETVFNFIMLNPQGHLSLSSFLTNLLANLSIFYKNTLTFFLNTDIIKPIQTQVTVSQSIIIGAKLKLRYSMTSSNGGDLIDQVRSGVGFQTTGRQSWSSPRMQQKRKTIPQKPQKFTNRKWLPNNDLEVASNGINSIHTSLEDKGP